MAKARYEAAQQAERDREQEKYDAEYDWNEFRFPTKVRRWDMTWVEFQVEQTARRERAKQAAPYQAEDWEAYGTKRLPGQRFWEFQAEQQAKRESQEKRPAQD